MWIRYRFDISWLDVLMAIGYSLRPDSRHRAYRAALRAWGNESETLVSLSVRSAWDTLLRALELPPNSEVLLSGLTVPDMAKIAAAHRLIPVPVDLDDAYRVQPAALRAAISTRSRVLVVAQLFGDQCRLAELAALAHQHGILLVEDRAQSLIRPGESGDGASDVVMHSFGPIKTATAFGGAISTVRSPPLLKRMREISEQDPVQSRWQYLGRVLKFSGLQLLTGPRLANLVRLWAQLTQQDFDHLLNSIGRGFRTENLLAQLRRQPCAPLLRLLARRWNGFIPQRIDRRRQLGQRLDHILARCHDPSHSYWVYPVGVSQPLALRDAMMQQGFDATPRSRLAIVPPTSDGRKAVHITDRWSTTVFLPWYPELTNQAIDAMGAIIRAHQENDIPDPHVARQRQLGPAQQ